MFSYDLFFCSYKNEFISLMDRNCFKKQKINIITVKVQKKLLKKKKEAKREYGRIDMKHHRKLKEQAKRVLKKLYGFKILNFYIL